MANRTDIDTFEKLNDVSRTIMADGLIGGKRFADIIIEIMQIAAAYGADEARRSAHFFATTKETDFEQLKAAIVLSATRTLFQSGNLDEIIRITALSAAAFGFQSQWKHAAYCRACNFI